MMPMHYDPLKEMYKSPTPSHIAVSAPGPYSVLGVTSDKMPRACVFLI
jgi:hypothetical protein